MPVGPPPLLPPPFRDLRLEVARSFLARARGLLFRPPLAPGEGLLIVPCRSVHTGFMRYPIDVVFLDREGRVLGEVRGLRPWRWAVGPRGTVATLELPAGSTERVS